MDIKIKRVYDLQENTDGLRILVDRLWPRGVKKEELSYDIWEKEIAPSTELRKWFHENPEGNWKQFVIRYEKELNASPVIAEFMKRIRKESVITLLYGAKDREHNQAEILKEFLEEKM